MMSEAPAKAPEPRPAATILLVRDDPFEVLMIRRHERQFFSSAVVFPGGTVDPSDHSAEWLDLIVDDEDLDPAARALRIAGFRETFEETGILLARGADHSHVSHDGGADTFLDVVRAAGGRLHLSDLVPFAHWVTPAASPKRFDTHFFVCRTAPGQEGRSDGAETVSLEWASPQAILDRAAAGETSLLLPQGLNVARLGESRNSAEALAAARARPGYTVQPQIEKREDGLYVIIPEEAGYGRVEKPADIPKLPERRQA